MSGAARMTRPHGERLARLEERHDATDVRLSHLSDKLDVVHDFVLLLRGGKGAILLVITVGGSLAGAAAGIVTVARFFLHF